MCIVERKTDKAVFALKYSDKEKSTKSKALYYIIQERNILEDVHHPFICAMRYSFQDNVNLYMVLDFMAGGDLRFHLKVNKRVSEVLPIFLICSSNTSVYDQTIRTTFKPFLKDKMFSMT